MSYYQHHIFLCINQRENKDCCAKRGAQSLLNYLKAKISVLTENQRYHYDTQNDINEIIEQHLLKQKIVHRLLLPNAK